MGKQGHNRGTQPEGLCLKVEGQCVAFADCFEPLRNNTYSRAVMTPTAGVANIHYGDVLVKYGEVLDFSTADVPSLLPGTLPVGDELRDGDIVIADTAEDETCGRTVEISNLGSRKAVAGLHTIACRPKPGLFVPGWLGYFMNSVAYHRQLVPLMAGIKVLSISRAALKGTTILVPPISKQRQIVSVFSECDRVVEREQKLLDAKKRQKHALIRLLLEPGGKDVAFGSFGQPGRGRKTASTRSSAWHRCRVCDCAEVRSGGTPTTGNPRFWNGGIPWVTPSEIAKTGKYLERTVSTISKEGLDNSSAELLPANTVVMCSRATIGPHAILKVPMTTNQGFKNFICKDNLDPEFWYYYLDVVIPSFLSCASGNTFKEVSKRDVEHTMVLLPPLSEQRHITAILSAADREIDGLAREIDAWKEKRKALSQLLLSGKVRV